MSDFMDSEAEESGEDLEETKEKDGNSDSEEEEEDGDKEDLKDLINDDPEEDQEDEDDEGPNRKRKLESDDDDDEIDDEDLELIQENTGIKIKKKKHSRVKLLDSDEEEEQAEQTSEREQIAQDLFDQQDEDDVGSVASSRPASRLSDKYQAVDVDEEGEDEEDIDDFIVDDDDQPINKAKKKKKSSMSRYTDSALQEAQDIFGLEFDLTEFESEPSEFDEDEEDEFDEEDEEATARRERRKAKLKASKKSIYEVYEPSELEKSHLTLRDNEIKLADIPERFQIRMVPVKSTDETEISEEAEWVYKQAFMQPPISQQGMSQDPNDFERRPADFVVKPATAIPKIKNALSLMKKDLFEVPYIATYKKEDVQPELEVQDLWKVYEWDAKWTQFTVRKNNMKRLFEEMQIFQYERTRENPEEPLEEGFRLLEQEDIDRLDNAQTIEELMDVYLHFQLYYGADVPALQEWKASKSVRRKKKMKKKTIRVKKMKQKSSQSKVAFLEDTVKSNESEDVAMDIDDVTSTEKVDEIKERSPKIDEEIENKEGVSNENKAKDSEDLEESVPKKSPDAQIDPETGENISPTLSPTKEDQSKSDDEKSLEDGSLSKKGTSLKDVDSNDDVDFTKSTTLPREDGDETEYEEVEIDVTDSEDELDENVDGDQGSKRKLPKRRDLYTICKDNGLMTMARRFGLTAEQFGENLRDNYQKHEPEQYHQEPLEAAEEYICNTFPSAEAVLSGARHMIAFEISRDPMVKQTVREVYYKRAKLYVTPTKKGKKDIDEHHSASPFKYLKSKPVCDLCEDQFLRIYHAESEGLIKINIAVDLDLPVQNRFTFVDEIQTLYIRDEFSNLVKEWNKQRSQALATALNQMVYPVLAKELKYKLLQEAKEAVVQACARKIRQWISIAPYQPDSNFQEEGDYGGESDSTHGCRVLAVSFIDVKDQASFAAMLDGDGQVVDFLRLKSLLKRAQSRRDEEREAKEKDMEKLKDFIKKYQPHVVALSAEFSVARTISEDLANAVSELEQEQQMSAIHVELVDGEVARLYQNSPRSTAEFPEYPDVLRHAISIGRRIQEPLVEFASLYESEDELMCLKLHPMQEHVSKDKLQSVIDQEFIDIVNQVGVDVNRALEYPHYAPLVQFICGLGPRKGGNLLKTLKTQGCHLENRSQLVTVCEMGLQVFLNCAGFIKITNSDLNDKYDLLDGTRIHPETYDWARKMAVDALEDEETMEESNAHAAVEEILDQPDRLKDLDLDVFAEELARQGYGSKHITLYDIRDELINRFKDQRNAYPGLTSEEKFRLLTGETSETFYVGKMITTMVTGYAYKKTTREELDLANPVRNDATNLWQCPFCLQDTFQDLSEVWLHFDDGSCPGQAIGLKTRLDNGVFGIIHTRNISDKEVKRPEERARAGMTLHARVLKIQYDSIMCHLTCRSSDLADREGKFGMSKDLYYDREAADKDTKVVEQAKIAQAKRTTYVKRVIAHPSFKNVTFKEAERHLDTLEQGDCIVRPSSKGADHLTVTWKVDAKIYQHIDVREEGKYNDFSLGKSLWIDNEEYEDLDEIQARHISPMAMHAREVLNHKYFKDTEGGQRQKLEEILTAEKRKAPSKIPYYFSTSKQYPGKFMLGYMPRHRPRIEYVTVTPDGFRYRGRVHDSVNALLKWFKEHFRDPIPGVPAPAPQRRMAPGTPMSMMGSNTPYTPGATPSNLITDEEASKLMQQAFPAGINPMYTTGLSALTPGTPGRSTPGGYSTPGSLSTPGFSTPGTTPSHGSHTPTGSQTPGSLTGSLTGVHNAWDFNMEQSLQRTPQSEFGTPNQPPMQPMNNSFDSSGGLGDDNFVQPQPPGNNFNNYHQGGHFQQNSPNFNRGGSFGGGSGFNQRDGFIQDNFNHGGGQYPRGNKRNNSRGRRKNFNNQR